MKIPELLAGIDLFKGMNPEDLNILAYGSRVNRYEAGQLIFCHGDTGSSMYIVMHGHVNIHLPGEGSRRISLKDITYGEYFGELVLFDVEARRTASALATTDVELLELNREAIYQQIERRPSTAFVLLQNLGGHLRRTNELLSQRAARNVSEEIEKRLTWSDKLADKIAALNGSWVFIILLIGITLSWMVINSFGILPQPFDPYPYVFFNLVLAILVAVQGPLIVMSQNRQIWKDRMQARIDFDLNLKNEVNIETLLREVGEMRMEVNSRLEKVEHHEDC